MLLTICDETISMVWVAASLHQVRPHLVFNTIVDNSNLFTILLMLRDDQQENLFWQTYLWWLVSNMASDTRSKSVSFLANIVVQCTFDRRKRLLSLFTSQRSSQSLLMASWVSSRRSFVTLVINKSSKFRNGFYEDTGNEQIVKIGNGFYED